MRLLYELEEIIHRSRPRPAASGVNWDDLDIVVDSLLAADFAAGYSQLREHWDNKARRKLAAGRHPLAFEQLTSIADHATHLKTVDYLARTARPASTSRNAGRMAAICCSAANASISAPASTPWADFRPCRTERPATPLHRSHA